MATERKAENMGISFDPECGCEPLGTEFDSYGKLMKHYTIASHLPLLKCPYCGIIMPLCMLDYHVSSKCNDQLNLEEWAEGVISKNKRHKKK